VIHSTRGNAVNADVEFRGTLNWFSNPQSQVSAHIVIGPDGTVAEVVAPDLMAWHAGQHNSTHLGVELAQPRQGDSITEAQYRSLAWWLRRQGARYGFPLTRTNLPEHRETAQGKTLGKSDVGAPYSYAVLARYLAG
jgi:N-acetyl-anhydromuramyl-L-alanine amidase AmpD